MRGALIVVLIAACERESATVVAPQQIAPTPALAPVVPVAPPVAPPIASPADAPVVAPEPPAPPPQPARPPTPIPKSGWLDQPAWPAGDRLAITWRVYPVLDGRDPETTVAPVELVATIGAASRRFMLKPQFGALRPLDQPSCAGRLSGGHVAYPFARGEVAKITFSEGGAGGFALRRSTPDVLALVAWEQGDGACAGRDGAPAACPRSETPILELHVPAGVTIHESIVEVDPAGAPHPLDCAM